MSKKKTTLDRRATINISMSAELDERIERLVQKSESKNITEMLKMALTLYEKAIDNKIAGGELQMLKTVEGQVQIVVIQL